MNKADHLLNRIAEPENIRYAAWKAAKGKRYSPEVLAYFADLENQVQQLRCEILSGEVCTGRYRHFKVYEPKERLISACAFSEQVLHHALMNLCHDRFEQAQIFDSYASRKNKGTYAAIDRARHYGLRNQWFLKLDVKKFFETVPHKILKWQLADMFKEWPVLNIFSEIIDSYEVQPSRGLPIGNLTSQYLANHFLSPLDHFIKTKLRVKSYVRYMDDMVLWHDDKAFLKDAHAQIAAFVQFNLQCELKPEALNRSNTGLPFLGYHIFPNHTRLLQKSKLRFFKKMKIVDEQFHSGEWCEAKCQRKMLPLLAFVRHADTKILRKNLLLRLKGQSP